MKTNGKSSPVAPKIRGLEKGKSVKFPAKRYSTVNSAVYMVELSTGKKFVREKIDNLVMITRVS